MTSSEIRQSFLDFFIGKEHTIVPSASLLPQSPGLLFTNAGMNQFVPYFLGTENAPYSPARAADTQKCIRAGGKHNDLEDVGYDTYHHTFFEMLGNWSFGDYFKKEAIEWSWELTTKVWKFPANRLYATVYSPSEGDPSAFDQEAYDLWKTLFEREGLDPDVHIVNGNVKDNFWMMGETGPCGPCSELHIDITPEGDTKGSLVNMDSDQCIEIWNLVFIQYNAEADGTFRDLPAKHIDTGMGFERVCSILQNTDGLTNFNKRISNYATDVFAPIFDQLTALSGKTYVDLYPHDERVKDSGDALEYAIAFRVIADHIRTLSLSIADGIQPGNTGRNYVLRRILRRAVKYGRSLGFSGNTLFLSQLVDTLADQLTVFPELKEKAQLVKDTLDREEKSFNKTLDRGLSLFEDVIQKQDAFDITLEACATQSFPADQAFKLYDTYGFPIDLTALLCRERGITLDEGEVEKHMEEQRNRARAAQKSEIVRAVDIETNAVTEFVGFESIEASAKVIQTIEREDATLIIPSSTPFYVEKGGQIGDTGTITLPSGEYEIRSTIQVGDAIIHAIEPGTPVEIGDSISFVLDEQRRQKISAHHTATHLLHWALHEHVSAEATQQGSMVSEERLRFDFNSAALTSAQIESLESAVNQCITENSLVSWQEVKHVDIKERGDIMQFFGDKYGEMVRVVQIGGGDKTLDGYSMELCGGTHVTRTSELGQFVIKKEEAIASGVRRIEALCGEAAENYIKEQLKKAEIQARKAFVNTFKTLEVLDGLDKTQKVFDAVSKPVREIENIFKEKFDIKLENNKLSQVFEALLSSQTDVYTPIKKLNLQLESITFPAFDLPKSFVDFTKEIDAQRQTLEKVIKKSLAANASKLADELLETQLVAGSNTVISTEGEPSLLQELLNGCKKRQFSDAAFIIVDDGSKLHLGAYCGESAQSSGLKAGDIIRELAAIAGGKGGGKPDQARGAAPQIEKKEEIAQSASKLLQS